MLNGLKYIKRKNMNAKYNKVRRERNEAVSKLEELESDMALMNYFTKEEFLEQSKNSEDEINKLKKYIKNLHNKSLFSLIAWRLKSKIDEIYQGM